MSVTPPCVYCGGPFAGQEFPCGKRTDGGACEVVRPPVPVLDPLLKGRADLAHAITAAIRRGALITIGPFGGGDDAAIRVSIEYRNTQITGTMVDPFEALALALAQWVRVHG